MPPIPDKHSIFLFVADHYTFVYLSLQKSSILQKKVPKIRLDSRSLHLI